MTSDEAVSESHSDLRSLWETPPRKLVFLARSFGRHALELGNPIPQHPLYFLKAPSALLPPGETLYLPGGCDEVHYEAEVAVLIGSKISQADPAEAEQAIAGWTILNDVTARDHQREDGGRFTRAKGHDGFCPISDQLLPHLSWRNAYIQGWLNGSRVQHAPLTDMLFTPGEAIASISQVMTLHPGDLVSLGTPSGVGPLRPGDHFEVRLCIQSDHLNNEEQLQVLLSLSHSVMS